MAHLVTNRVAPPRSCCWTIAIQVRPSVGPAHIQPAAAWHNVGARCAQRRTVIFSASDRPGGSVLDAPTLPGMEKSTEHVHKRPPLYKVMLHNDSYNRREYVVKVLLKVIKELTVDDAEAHETGVAMVVTCPQEDAERYCEGLRLNGLTSSIEPGR